MKGRIRSRALLSSFFLLAQSALFAVVATSQGQPAYNIGAAAAGEVSFKTYCAACHGKAAKGDGPLAKDLKTPPADLTQLSSKNGGQYPYDIVYQTIDGRKPVKGHGSREMPAWGDAFKATDNEAQANERITQLTHYLWSIQEASKK